jgi:sortase A
VSRGGDVVRTVLRGIGQTLITLGLVVLLFCVYQLQVTNLVTSREQDRLGDALRRSWAEPRADTVAGPAPTPSPTTSPTTPSPTTASPAPAASAPPGAPVPVARQEVEIGKGFAVLRIPRLGDWNDDPLVVVEGVGVGDLKKGPGHMPGTAMPGEVGNVVVSGHRTTYGAPFERLDELRRGDAIVIETRDTWFTYTMSGSQVVAPSAVEVTYAVPGEPSAAPTRRLLTLTTCHPKYSARQRLIVSAELTAAEPKSGGSPAALAAD